MAVATSGTYSRPELDCKVSEMAHAVGWCPGQTGITHAQKGMLCDLYQCHWGYLADNKLTVYSERKYAAVVMLKLSNRGTHVDVYALRRSKCCLFRLDDLERMPGHPVDASLQNQHTVGTARASWHLVD